MGTFACEASEGHLVCNCSVPFRQHAIRSCNAVNREGSNFYYFDFLGTSTGITRTAIYLETDSTVRFTAMVVGLLLVGLVPSITYK